MTNKMQRSKLHKVNGNDRGVALIVAVVIISILIVFTFSLMLAAYTLYSSQNKNVSSMMCTQAANTLSAALDQELMYENKSAGKYPEKDSYLYRYLRYNLCQSGSWPYYREGTAGHGQKEAYRIFELVHANGKKVQSAGGKIAASETQTITSIEGKPGRVKVCMYWEPPKYATETELADNASNLSSKKGIILHVIVTCESASQTYSVEKKYELDISHYGMEGTSKMGRIVSAASDPAVNPLGINPDVDTEKFVKDEQWIWSLAEEQ